MSEVPTPQDDETRRRLGALIGGWHGSLGGVSAEPIATEEGPAGVIEHLRLDLGRVSPALEPQPIPALLTRPKGNGPFPAVLYIHAHGYRYEVGKRELIEARATMQAPPYGAALSGAGIAALCFDLPCFGERRHPSESALTKRLLWQGDTLFGVMLRELAAALDYLQSRSDIAPRQIGVLGRSMGATLAYWLAAFDDRIAAIANLNGFADLGTLLDGDRHDLHGIYMLVPGLLNAFTTEDVARLVVPRPHLVCLGNLDPLTPPDAVETVVGPLAAAYAAAGATSAFEVVVEPDAGHEETARMRATVLTFLAQHLGAGTQPPAFCVPVRPSRAEPPTAIGRRDQTPEASALTPTP